MLTHNFSFSRYFQILWSYFWSELAEVPTISHKGVHIPTGKKKVLGMFSSNASGKLVLLIDEQQKKYLVAQCQRLMQAARWRQDVERMSLDDWLSEFFLLMFNFRMTFYSIAYFCGLHHLTLTGLRWTLRFSVLLLSVYWQICIFLLSWTNIFV